MYNTQLQYVLHVHYNTFNGANLFVKFCFARYAIMDVPGNLM